MKKSQILAALALAFALGVAAIPTADTYAKIVKLDKYGAEVIDEESTKKLEEAIQTGKESCGWHLVGTGASAVKTWYYDQFLALDEVLTSVAKKVENEQKYVFDSTTGENVAGGTITDLKTAYSGVFTDTTNGLNKVLGDNGVTLPSSITTTLPDSVTNYSQAVTYINNMRGLMTTESTRYNSSDKDVAEAYRTAVKSLETALEDAAEAIDNVKEWASDNQIQPAINAITGNTTIDTELTYNQAVVKANNLTTNTNGSCSIAKANNLKTAIEYAEGLLLGGNSYWNTDAEKAIALIVKAQNGGTITDGDVNKPNDGNTNKPSTNDPTAPDTGIIADAEGNASTTVAMVAGVATALTAAGAGVVAYRNARRSTRK